jgi:hypothetical protein
MAHASNANQNSYMQPRHGKRLCNPPSYHYPDIDGLDLGTDSTKTTEPIGYIYSEEESRINRPSLLAFVVNSTGFIRIASLVVVIKFPEAFQGKGSKNTISTSAYR